MKKKWDNVYIFYLLLCISAYFYISGKVKYFDIEEWPSVPASGVFSQSVGPTATGTSPTGSTVSTSPTERIEYSYDVNGLKFKGRRYSPNGGALPINAGSYTWRVYYDPKSPETAVLVPEPYRGYVWIFLGVVGIVVVSVDIYFKRKGEPLLWNK